LYLPRYLLSNVINYCVLYIQFNAPILQHVFYKQYHGLSAKIIFSEKVEII